MAVLMESNLHDSFWTIEEGETNFKQIFQFYQQETVDQSAFHWHGNFFMALTSPERSAMNSYAIVQHWKNEKNIAAWNL